jgi:4-carboxymuconolactone decarboxylase
MHLLRTSLAVMTLVATGLTSYVLGATNGLPRAIAQPSQATNYPADIDPRSHNRLPYPKREDLDALGQAQYDETVNDPNSLAGLIGPGGIRIYNSELNAAARPVNQYLRFKAGIPRNIAELAILATAREVDAHFEWAAHEPAALKVGVAPATIDIVRNRRPLDGVPEPDATVIELAREAVGKHHVSSATYQRALNAFGRKELIALDGLMGDYAATAILLATFDMHLPPGAVSKLPE